MYARNSRRKINQRKECQKFFPLTHPPPPASAPLTHLSPQGKEKMLHLWFNTFFIDDSMRLRVRKAELDKVVLLSLLMSLLLFTFLSLSLYIRLFSDF